MQETQKHILTLTDRETLTLTGVADVLGFDEETVSMDTLMGNLVVKGVGLHINKLSLETGEVSIDGKISSLQYLGTNNKKGIMSKIFK